MIKEICIYEQNQAQKCSSPIILYFISEHAEALSSILVLLKQEWLVLFIVHENINIKISGYAIVLYPFHH